MEIHFEAGLKRPRDAPESTKLVSEAAVVSVLGTGVPRLACLRPAAWLKWGPSASQLHQLKLKTLARGQASRGGR